MEQVERRRPEWDLNQWNWDGHLFIATPTSTQFIPPNSTNTTNTTSSSSSDDLPDQRKRRAPDANIDLNLGGGGAVTWDSKKKGGPMCQVENCAVELSKAKDYHRRHKVCDFHSKATHATVNNLMQRFCQQCSRFHVLEEFDEGKRSCRRRLAGHNKRRRKTQPDAPLHPNPIQGDHTNSLLLITLLKLLSNMHANNGSVSSDQMNNQDFVAQLLRSLANPSALQPGKGLSTLLYDSQKLLHGEGSRNGVLAIDKGAIEMQSTSPTNPASLFPIKESPPSYSNTTAGRTKMNNFDLNDTYVDSDDGTEYMERSPINSNYVSASLDYPPWASNHSHQSSPPQNSGNSDSASAPSPSSSSGEAPSRTDRIVFKLFGKEPSEFPMVLRGQILDWLAHSPTDIESYIRPGCIVLTVYLRLAESMWEELCCDLSSCLNRLFNTSDDPFWHTGWVFVRVQNQIAFAHNGQVVLDTSLSLHGSNFSQILSVMPVAVCIDEKAQFSIRGSNLSRSATRLLCSLEGSYLDQEASQESGEDSDNVEEGYEIDHAKLTYVVPAAVTGRGFIEVEDHGLSSSFFPFIVTEKDVCADIRTLESVLDLKETDEDTYEYNGTLEARRQALDFLNEMGWLLHRIHLRSRLAHLDPSAATFSFKRFRWLMDFSMDHDWCAVVKKLLDIFVVGSIGYGEHSSLKVALSEMGLLHRAVRRNCRSMVEFLLRYVPVDSVEEFTSSDGDQASFMFRPDAQGPVGLTPLHVAAGRDGAEDILDALTGDPNKIGLEAWKNAHDSTGATPEDYARLRGHYGYIHMVQRKMNTKSSSGHVVVDILGEASCTSVQSKHGGGGSFEIVTSGLLSLKQSCKMCDRKMAYYGNTRTSLVYRPAMLSMVAIAAVCVCVALLFKSMPDVVCLFQPFRWEMLNYGSS